MAPPSDSLDLVDSVVKTTSLVWVLIIDLSQAIEEVMASVADDKAGVDSLHEVDVRFDVLLRFG